MTDALDLLGDEFANASTSEKVRLLDKAIGRVTISQSSEAGSNRNQRADLEKLIAARKYFAELVQTESSGGSEILMGWM